jgi:hypothetical protein
MLCPRPPCIDLIGPRPGISCLGGRFFARDADHWLGSRATYVAYQVARGRFSKLETEALGMAGESEFDDLPALHRL